MAHYRLEFEGTPTPAFREELIKMAGREWDERKARGETTSYTWRDVSDTLNPPMFDRIDFSHEFEERHGVKFGSFSTEIDRKEQIAWRRRQTDEMRLKGDSELWSIVEEADAETDLNLCAAIDVLIERARAR